MKKIFGILLCALVLTTKVYAEEGIPTEKQYNFDRANVAAVLAEFIEDDKLALKAADRYNELSREGSEKISAVDFVDVCVVGGLNIKAIDGSGYTKCLEMFMRLIEMQNQDIGDFNMYCPATGNALKSITDTSRVGDVCGGTSDTYIEYGFITLKADNRKGHKYICTCTAMSCKDGYYWNKDKYQCSVKDKEGYCVRHILGSYEYGKGPLTTALSEWDRKQNAYYNETYNELNANVDAFSRCVEYGTNNNCVIRGALASVDVSSGFGTAKKYQVICNPENYEISADKKAQEEKRKKHEEEELQHRKETVKYYEVCGEDKGKGTCIDNVFTKKIIGGTQVSYAVGNALVKEYARVKLGDEITCGGDNYDKNIRKETVAGMRAEYYIKCASLKNVDTYYEFKFDDLEESKDFTANSSVYNAVWHIIYDYHLAKNSHNGYDTKTKANCDAVDATFKKICNGCGTEWRESGYAETKGKKFCYDKIYIPADTCKKSPNDLNTAFDIDPFVFCKNTHNQLKNTGGLENSLKQYISDKSGYNVSKIECYPQTLCYSGKGCGGIIDSGDDIKTCVVHGDKDYTVDFVFDDVNEFSKKLSEVSMDAMQCVIGGNEISITLGFELDAKNKGKKCTGLDDKLCKDLDKMIRNRGGSGAHYDTKKRACILDSAEEYATQELAQNIAIGTVITIGVSVATIGSGGVASALVVGGTMFAVDTAVNGGLYIVEKLEDGQAGRRFNKFMKAAKKCNKAKCARKIIEDNYNDLSESYEELNYKDLSELETELKRLFDLMNICYSDENGFVYIKTENDCALNVQLDLKTSNHNLQKASLVLIVGSFVFNPQTALARIFKNSKKIVVGVEKLYDISQKFDKQFILRSGTENSLGKDYYRIFIKDGDNVDEIVTALKKEGYYVSSNYTDKTKEKFLAVSTDNIFGPWKNLANNWLTHPSVYSGKLKGWKVSRVEDVKVYDGASVFVYKFKEETTGKTYYLKYTDKKDEIKRTKRAHEILEGNSDVVHVAKVVEDDQEVLSDFTTKQLLQQKSGHYWFLMEETPSSYSTSMIISDFDNAFYSVLGGKPITLDEQEEILKAVKRLNNNGIYHGDLYSNMFFMREPGGKLRVDIIDFEPWSSKGKKDIEDIETYIFGQLAKKGGAEYSRAMVENLAKKEFPRLIGMITECKSVGKCPLARLDDLTAKEWEEVNKYIKQHGVELVDDVFDNGTPAKRMQKIGVVRDKNVDHITTLKQKVSSNFDKHVDEVLNGDNWYLFDKGRLTDSEWAELNKDLNKRGIELVDDVFDDGTPGKKMQKIGSKKAQSVTTKTSDALDGIVSKYNKTAVLRPGAENSLGKDYYRITINQGDDVSAMIEDLKREGYFISSNQTEDGEKFLAVSKQNIFGSWTKSSSNWLAQEVQRNFDVWKQADSPNGFEFPKSYFANGQESIDNFSKMLKKEGAYLEEMGDKIIIRKPGKNGRALKRVLNNAGLKSVRNASDQFYEVEYRTTKQCATGLKFHVSVHPEDLEGASFIVDDLVRNTDVADAWKVAVDGFKEDQRGKDFTIYVSPNGYYKEPIQNFLSRLEGLLRKNNVRSNGFGINISSTDRRVPGSNYINYRYDLVNNSGIPDGIYNSSYFVTPRAEYGGDILDGITVGY